MVGQLADHGLITGQRVVPKHALAGGFAFQYPDIGAAVEAAIKQ
jgi:NAD dependent epimerase/dehydratase family enzyme